MGVCSAWTVLFFDQVDKLIIEYAVNGRWEIITPHLLQVFKVQMHSLIYNHQVCQDSDVRNLRDHSRSHYLKMLILFRNRIHNLSFMMKCVFLAPGMIVLRRK